MSTDALTDDAPRVQIPVASKYHALSVDGEVAYAIPEERMDDPHGFIEQYGHLNDYLPPKASEAYWGHYNTDNHGWVYQCEHCGYLSMSKYCRVASPQKTECGHCEATSWKRVWPGDSLLTVPEEKRDEVELDILSLEAGKDVPNHASHLGRIQNQVRDHVTKADMLRIVAASVEEAREAGTVDY